MRRKPSLKLIYVAIDGLGDLPINELENQTPLGAANTPNMDNLAKNGKTGLMYTVRKGIAPESDVGVISILGYDPFKYATGRGILEAVGADMPIKNGELALRCNFATLGHGNKIIDRRAGRDLTQKEAEALTKSVNEKVRLSAYLVSFKLRSTIGHRAVLVIKNTEKPLSGKITNTDPAYTRIKELGIAEAKAQMFLKECEPIDKSDEAKISAALVNEFVEESHKVLENHEVNKNRVDEGKFKANVILTRDAGHLLPKFFDINKRYNVHFACLANMPVERGIAKLAGMHLVELPLPSGNLEDDCLLGVTNLLEILPSYDCFYIHIKGPDEPAHDGNYQQKTEQIATIDRDFFGSLLKNIDLSDYLVCVTADHSTPCSLKAHSDTPVPLLISNQKIQGDNVSKFSEEECRRGSLGILKHGYELMPILIGLLKRKN